ncbi:MAG: tetratricopeptide repeat protein [Coleofasciculaceae cyanobacterium]
MQTLPNEFSHSLSEADQAELNKLVSILELSSGTTTIFAVALESGPNHPVVEQLKFLLSASEENFQFQNFFYSDNSLHNFLYSLDEVNSVGAFQPSLEKEAREDEGRKVVMAFGLDQLPTPRLVREMKQLNLGRESIFGHELVLIFWLNKAEFLDEFRHRAPDFWDWRGKMLKFEARPVFNSLFYPYLQWLIAENSYLKITGVMQVQRQVDIFLDQIYVSLQAEKQQQVTEISHRSLGEFEAVTSQHGSSRRSSSAHDDFELLDDFEPMLPDFLSDVTRTKTVTKKVDLAQAVRESQYSVILGAPGAGKTTLLKYLALHFATAKRDSKEIVFGGAAQEELGKSLLPILFRIADYAERLRKQPDLSLLEYLRQFYRQWEAYFETEETCSPASLLQGGSLSNVGTNIIQLLLEQMRHGNCLMLLDGLDEVFDQESRRQIVEQINQFVEEFSSNKFVITSRIAGYQDVKLSGRFAEFTIEDMGYEQAEQFLHRWCRAIERAQQPDASEEQCQRKGDAEAQAILEAIQANEGVQRLTANPLLLTILALIHRNGSRLPSQRVKLYELAADTLIEDWQLAKDLPDARKVILKKNEVTKLLTPLAYWMHEEKPSGLVTQAEVEENLAAQLAQANDAEPDSDLVRQGVVEFLRKVRETTGLFVEREPGVYGFMHLTFEEYFAARYIAENDQSDILEIIHSHLHEPRWNETILLAFGYYSVHCSTKIDKLINKFFSNLEVYQPTIQGGEIKVKNGSSQDAILIWSALPDESTTVGSQSDLRLKDLLFAGQVLAEVEVNSSIRRKLVQQLVLTYLGLRFDTEIETIKQLLRLLRQIELFHQKGETIAQLQQAYDNSTLYELVHIKAQLAILYIVCGEPGIELVSYVSNLVNNLNPFLFGCIRLFFQAFGEDMRFALQTTLHSQNFEGLSKSALSLLTALSYIRKDYHHKAITLLEELDNQLNPYIKWTFAAYHSDRNEYDKAINFYQQAFDEFSKTTLSKELLIFLLDWGSCYASIKKYEQSIECCHQALALVQEPNTDLSYSVESVTKVIAFGLIGGSYQEWGKYEQAIQFYQKIFQLCQNLNWDETIVVGLWHQFADCYRDWGKYDQGVECELKDLAICQQLDDKPNIANAYYYLGHIYRDWGKYEQAIECQQQCLTIRQTLDDQSAIASAYYQLGRIYQAWGKYEQALSYYQQSRELYQQLGKEKDIANQWYNLADCYRDWGKYEQAIECQEQCLMIRQTLDDQSAIASAYYQLGRIYQAWGKYEQAIECQQQCLTIRQTIDDQSAIAVTYHQLGYIYQAWGKYEQALSYYQQSRELYQQLGKEKDIANQWYWLAICYRDWGKYEQAIECEFKDLAIRQQLEDQPNIADAYYQLGYIYQAWGKYEQALSYYQQSRQIYEQLGKEKNVANLWYWLADCYRNWGKYQQAIECQQQCLTIRQTLDDQSSIAANYSLLGHIYQAWGKYEQAINYHQQSRELYQQLGKDKNVANQWYWLADCYSDWGKYEQAIECEFKDLAVRQQLEDQRNIADAYYQLGYIYQAWGKYEQAIDYHQQSRELYQQLGKEKNVANLWYWLADCYRIWGKYDQAINCQEKRLTLCQQLDDQLQIANVYYELGRIYQAWGKYEQALSYYQQSQNFYQQLGKDENIARNYRRIAHNQSLLAKDNLDKSRVLDLLTQAEQNLHQAIQLNTAGDYKNNLAYDYIELGLLWSEHIHILPTNDPSLPEKITQFEEYYNIGFTYLTELGKIVSRANKALDIARLYLENNVLENLERAESLAKKSLQIYQEYNRRKLEASARKLLGEIYIKHVQHNQLNAEETATQFLTESLKIYRELDVSEKAVEVEQLLHLNAPN